jgi:ATP-dependent RNA helicase DHX40
MASEKEELPIKRYQDGLIESVKTNACVIITGETGCGKTTQLPQYLHGAGFSGRGMIGVTQPRRVAAISVARRVSEELGCRLGGAVGYQVRFDDCTSPDTKIKYLTDGCLLRELLDDPHLSSYSVIILDEAHERSLATDVLFGLMKQLLRQEDTPRTTPLHLVIMSATLDVQRFSDFFNKCPIFTIPGRLYPVTINYVCTDETFDPKKPTYLSQITRVAMEIHLDQGPGDILVFLTGQQEIETICDKLFKSAEKLDYRYDVACKDIQGLAILPLYGSLPTEQQQRIFRPVEEGVRRVIVSTNIAATSVTVDGVVYVIDSGYVKQLSYNPRTGLDILQIVPISKSECAQRAGRAGRTMPGHCYRLYSQSHYDSLRDDTIPEIQRTSLTSVILDLKSMGISNVIQFDYLDPPEERMITEALKQLYYYEAIDDNGDVTSLGKQLVLFPLQPGLARVLICSKQLDCDDVAVPIVAMLSVENVYIRPSSKIHMEAALEAHKYLQEKGGQTNDFATLLAIYKLASESGNERRWCDEHYIHLRAIKTAQSIVKQLTTIMKRIPVDREGVDEAASGPLSERLRQSLCYGLFCNAARLAPGRRNFRTMDGHGTIAYLHPSSVLFGNEESLDWVIYYEIVDTARAYIRTVCPVRYGWVKDYLPRLHQVDPYKLSACERKRTSSTSSNSGSVRRISEGGEAPPTKRLNTDDSADVKIDKTAAARERYLARKKQMNLK